MRFAKRFLPSYLIALYIIPLAVGQKVGVSSALGFGCWNCALRWNFGCGTDQAISSCHCNNTAFLTTVLNCVNRHSHGQEDILWGYQYVEKFCKSNYGIHHTVKELELIYGNSAGILLNPNDIQKFQLLYEPVDINEFLFKPEFLAAKTAKQQYRLGTFFGIGLLVYWAIILSSASVIHYCRTSPNRLSQKCNGKITTAIRRHVSLPAIFKESHNKPIKVFAFMTIRAPTRGQSIIISLYVLMNILVLCFFYHTYTPNPYINNRKEQILRYMGNRTGIICFTQMPLLVLFASRNNPIRSFTGWSYQTFQVYHHWTARMTVLHALIHAICFTWLAIISDSISFRWQIRNWRFGNIALYVSVVILVIASNTVRAKFYEFFSFSHKLLFIVFLIGVSLHCIDFGWMVWVYLTIGIYASDLICRVIRVFVYGPIKMATFEYCDDDTYRISTELSHKNHSIAPGAYIYLRVLSKDLFWQSHPFTVYNDPNNPDRINTIVKKRKGSTKKVMDLLLQQEKKKIDLPVMIEGFYGSFTHLGNYDCIMLVAGGTGITAIFSQIMSLLSTKRPYPIKLLWAIHSPSPLKWFADEVKYLLSRSKDVEVHIYISRILFEGGRLVCNYGETDIELGVQDDATECDVESIDDCGLVQQLHHISGGRPKLRQEIANFITNASGSTAICSCGPPTFVDRARYTVVKNIGKSDHHIDYFEEPFSC